MRRDYSFDFDDEEKRISSTHRLNMHPVIEPEPEGPMFSRGQKMSMVISLALLVYAVLTQDVPLAFLVLSFLGFLLRPLAEKSVGPWLARAIKGFSIALGIGALVLAFL
ncbi:MAG: hypothetical protein IJ812_03865 [Schwartzia sp.]|nr:hypothetical protein [Schwartzia sp. (in: firmicutes)]MBR1761473.1 hypothetical protein [Schwartzia sp. (in: firmicutes)]MBR1885525.1 hypothetical protein [Schwartzia sp. (in: firmicutes)]